MPGCGSAGMLKIFREVGEKNSRNSEYQFWQQDNQPKIIYTPDFARQKLENIHDNPVDAGLVEKAEEYIYSSASDYYYGKQCGLLKLNICFRLSSLLSPELLHRNSFGTNSGQHNFWSGGNYR